MRSRKGGLWNPYLILTPKQDGRKESGAVSSYLQPSSHHQQRRNRCIICLQMKFIPPDALTVLPVTQRLSSEHKNLRIESIVTYWNSRATDDMTGTMSGTSPTLAAAGVISVIGWKSARTSDSHSVHISVETGPELTVDCDAIFFTQFCRPYFTDAFKTNFSAGVHSLLRHTHTSGCRAHKNDSTATSNMRQGQLS